MITNMQKWFKTLVIFLAKRGHAGHTAVPVLAPSGGSLLTKPCPVCDNPRGFVFQSTKDSKTFLLACRKCKSITVRRKGAPKNPIDAATQGMVKGVKSLSCGCGAPLPKGRKKFCHTCRPASNKVPKEVDIPPGV